MDHDTTTGLYSSDPDFQMLLQYQLLKTQF